EAFATLADGTMRHNPRCYRTAERRLKTAHRRVSRRKQGSNRRRKAVKLLAKAHLKVKRQRQDFQHKAALQLVREYDSISHEDVQVANLLKTHHLAKSIQDAGWYTFLSILACKAACAGKQVIAVHPAETSQTCSGGGGVVKKGLSVRGHACPDCGTSLHRDHHAARNRKNQEREAWATPSGDGGVGRPREPSIPRLQPWRVSKGWYLIYLGLLLIMVLVLTVLVRTQKIVRSRARKQSSAATGIEG